MYRLTPRAPEPGLFFEDTGDGATARMANRLTVADIQVPGREHVPVAADQDFTTLMTVGAGAPEIMNITGKDVTEPVPQCNFPGFFQAL